MFYSLIKFVFDTLPGSIVFCYVLLEIPNFASYNSDFEQMSTNELIASIVK